MASNHDDEFEDDLEGFDDILEEGDLQNDGTLADEPLEETLSDDDWDSYDEPIEDMSSAQPQDSPPKKKSSTFNKILIGVAVIGAAGFFVMQMGKGPAKAPAPQARPAAEQQQAEQQQAAVPSTPTPPTPPSPAAPAATPEETPGLLSDPKALADMQRQIADRLPTATQAELKEVTDVAVPPMPTAMTAVVDDPNPQPALERHMPTAQDVMLKNPKDVPTPVSAPVSPPVPGVVANDVAVPPPSPTPALAEPVAMESPSPAPSVEPAKNTEALEQTAKIESLNAQLAELSAEIKMLKAQSKAQSEEDKATIEKLKQTIEAQEKTPDRASAETPAQPEPKILGPADDEANSVPGNLDSLEPVQVKKSAPVIKTVAPSASVKESAEWVLKGAQPGRAMVAKAGETDIRSVGVGDTLPGIGRITAVTYENGRWSVLGTKGRINQ